MTNTTDIRDTLLSEISDTFKDINGVRPHFSFDDTSNEGLEVYLNGLYDVLENEVLGYDKKDVAIMLERGAKDEETAIRWAKELQYNY